MKAIVCTRYGPPEVLELKDVDAPIPEDGEVRVKVHATTVTRGDVRIRGFRVPRAYWLPARLALGLRRPRRAILGPEVAGEIESVGKDVTRFRKGDPVFGTPGDALGGYAEYICLRADGMILAKPSNVSYEEAAAIPIGGLTALHFLRKGRVQSGQRVMVYGASGSVGTFAVQLAKYLGAKVTGVCGTANVDLVISLGAHEVVDYTKEDFAKDAGVYDVIYDTVGKSPFSGCMRALKEGGVYLQSGSPTQSVRMRWAKMTTGKRVIVGTPAQKDEYLKNAGYLALLKELVEARKLKPVIDRHYALSQIVEAHRYVDTGHKRGNVVITVNHDDRAP